MWTHRSKIIYQKSLQTRLAERDDFFLKKIAALLSNEA